MSNQELQFGSEAATMVGLPPEQAQNIHVAITKAAKESLRRLKAQEWNDHYHIPKGHEVLAFLMYPGDFTPQQVLFGAIRLLMVYLHEGKKSKRRDKALRALTVAKNLSLKLGNFDQCAELFTKVRHAFQIGEDEFASPMVYWNPDL